MVARKRCPLVHLSSWARELADRIGAVTDSGWFEGGAVMLVSEGGNAKKRLNG